MSSQGAIEAEWMSAPTKAWCHVRRALPARADAPPQLHSQVQPPWRDRATRGWWCARSAWDLRCVTEAVIGMPFVCGGFTSERTVCAFIQHHLAGGRACLCPRRHSAGERVVTPRLVRR